MAKYTTQVRSICEVAAGLTESAGFNDVNTIIQMAIPNVFNFDFPIYDESYRNVLCTKILKHYYTREICAETVGLWKLWLSTRLNEIMPYYNQLYKSTMLEFNPMYDVDLTTTHTRNNEGMSNSTSNINGEDNKTEKGNDEDTTRDMFSDTPQGALDNVENMTYLTNARKITHDSKTSSNSSGNYTSTNNSENKAKSTEDYIEKITSSLTELF